MKKAIIATGGKQYLVKEGDVLDVELLKAEKAVEFKPLLIIDGEDVKVGKPILEDSKVTVSVTEPIIKAEKVIAIRYKAKKRVKKIQGHRQKLTKITITKII